MNTQTTFTEIQDVRSTGPQGRSLARLVEMGLLIAVAALLIGMSIYAVGAYQDVQTSFAQIGSAHELG